MAIFGQEHPNGLQMQVGYEKIDNFRSIYHFISETIQHMAIVIRNRQLELVYDLSNVSFPMTLNDL